MASFGFVAKAADADAAAKKPPDGRSAAGSGNALVSDDELASLLGGLEGDSGAQLADAPAGPSAPEGASPKKLKFKLGDKTAAAAAGATPEASKPPPVPQPRWLKLLSRAIYDGIDAVLRVANRPFFWLPRNVRDALGMIAIPTVIASLAFYFAAPMLFPRRDAITFLADKRAALEHAAQDNTAPSSGGPTQSSSSSAPTSASSSSGA